MSEITQPSTGQPNLVLTPEEKKVFGQLFQAADTQNLGVITGELAVKFFEKSGLKPQILGEIWGIADTENRGLLTKVGFSVALRLIGQAQSGQAPRPELAQFPGPLPTFKGVNANWAAPGSPQASSQAQVQQPPTSPIQQQLSGSGIAVPRLSPEDVTRFIELFEKSGAVDGLLPGESARQIFQRAKLANTTLGLIWGLADRQQRGALGSNEFVVAMHLIQCTMNGSLPVLPTSLPQALFDAASRSPRPPTGDGRQRPSPGAGPRVVPPSIPTVPSIPRQFGATRAQSPLRQQYTPPPMPPPSTAPPGPVDIPWAITAVEKQKFDNHFTDVDTGNKGFITGEEAVPFFSGSKLPEDALAQIWDLADIEKNGSLTRDEFAIAMYLIRQERTRGTNGKGLPDALPLNLIPPHLRPSLAFNAQASPKPPVPSPFDPPAAEPPKSNLDELFGLDDSFTTASSAQASSSGAAPLNTTLAGSSDFPAPRSPLPAPVPTSTLSFLGGTKPFVPSSSFGQNMISPSATGGTTSSKDTPSHLDDLLDPEVNKKLTSESTELANLSNQIGSLTKQTQDLKMKRLSADQNLANVANEKHNIELKLAQLRQSYEHEERELKRVEEILATSRAETTRLRNDSVMLEATLTDLRNQKAQSQAAYDADVKENQSLKEKMRNTNQETAELKRQLEKLKHDARQQKGLVAINKKQLATSEAERERVKGEIEKEKADLATSLSRTTSPQPPASPTLSQTSTMSTNPFNANPFHRKSPTAPVQESASVESRFHDRGFFESAIQSSFASPASNPGQNAFDNVFGSFSAPSGTGPPPPTSFSRQNTGSKDPSRSITFSALSATESAFGGSTPPTSPPTSSYSSHTAEIPPSVGSPHITSAFLPLTLNRADSTTSSVQVQASSESAFSRPETPTTTWPGSLQHEPKPEPEADAFKPSPLSHSAILDQQEPKKLERARTGSTAGGSPVAARISDKRDSASDFGSVSPSVAHIPGAFPGIDITTPIKPTATGESYMSNRSRVSQAKSEPLNFGFGGQDNRGSQAAKDDFDAAFAGFSQVKPERPATSNQEFPPIRELQNDDESDTASETGGFDDNFTSASPKVVKTTGASQASEQPPSVLPVPESNIAASLASNSSTPLPGPNAQTSPPTYTSTTGGANNDTSAFPPEFTNLLPPRADPTKTNTNSPPAQTAGTAKMFMSSPAMTPPATTSNLDSVFGPAITPAPQPTTTAPTTSDYSAFSSVQSKPATQPATQGKSAFDDDTFESDFKDLGEAREANSKSDEYDNYTTDHGYAEFNDVFDSPGAAKHVPTAPIGTKNIPDDDEFSAFQFNTLQTTQPAQSSNDDWDALFASLDKPGSSGQPANSGPSVGQVNGGDARADDAFNVTAPPAVTANLTGGKKVDPDVRKLQNMGFSEEQATMALKKFDNNLSEATNFLLDLPTSPGSR
ncbi:hypothetical protein TWF569_011597 [Orbilia oligospora]|uniref:Uncharacterized protein n=1 Tax=Orbilia oligospora TaxID=2813651 RepID=A0A7C8JPI8_ORBOL|nr:hypothetical protein TWF102_007225 [Orbilia oligospora]KAF3102827.1 hypothetical protein TWF103_007530 [Orbilia oligospora]KAF3113121.1 hypothetical protein TWF706_010121 [Orbilia oligospora]KAF3125032.1 hypothetical protein TWF594_001727 [Orbilia oligospora]KAF3127896.1 hypothetical protein TWF569_011597 [Orbilia oligospora]